MSERFAAAIVGDLDGGGQPLPAFPRREPLLEVTAAIVARRDLPLQRARPPTTSCEAPGSPGLRSASSRGFPFQPSGGLQITSTASVPIGSTLCIAVLRATPSASDGE